MVSGVIIFFRRMSIDDSFATVTPSYYPCAHQPAGSRFSDAEDVKKKQLLAMFRDFVMDLHSGTIMKQLSHGGVGCGDVHEVLLVLTVRWAVEVCLVISRSKVSTPPLLFRPLTQVHLQLLDGLETMKLDELDGRLIEFPLSAVSAVYRVVRSNGITSAASTSYTGVAHVGAPGGGGVVPGTDGFGRDGGMGGAGGLGGGGGGGNISAGTSGIGTTSGLSPAAAPDADHLVVLEFMRKKLAFLFADMLLAQRFVVCMELLIKRAKQTYELRVCARAVRASIDDIMSTAPSC